MYSGLLSGLGNPGAEYAGTRHNFGFMLIDAVMREAERQKSGSVSSLSSKGKYELWKCRIGSQWWLLQKPLTFMNLSGEAIAPVLAYYKLGPEDLVVAHDELDFPLGRLKLQTGSGAAGHNGIKSTLQCLGGSAFWRLRLGIGKPQGGGSAGYVLGRFTNMEQPIADKVLTSVSQAFWSIPEKGFEKARRDFNIIDFSINPSQTDDTTAPDKQA